MGPNTFSEPWHLPHTPPEEIKEIVYAILFIIPFGQLSLQFLWTSPFVAYIIVNLYS